MGKVVPNFMMKCVTRKLKIAVHQHVLLVKLKIWFNSHTVYSLCPVTFQTIIAWPQN